MTIKLFYENSRITEFTSEIVTTIFRDNKYHVVLKETAFYPEGGGQPSDTGEISGISVENVYEKDNIIYHIIDKPIDDKNIFGRVDYSKRFDYMQQHSGEHILAAAFYKLFNANNVGFHMGEEYSTLDVSMAEISESHINLVENHANELIGLNIPIKCYIVNRSQLNSIPLRKKTSINNDIRIVEIENHDYSACCGIHVNTTSEVGLIKIIRTEKYKGNLRVYFKCGNRALDDYRSKHKTITELTKLLSEEECNILKRVINQNNCIKEQQKKISDLKKQVFIFEANNIKSSLNSNIFRNVYEDKSLEELEQISKILNEDNITTVLASKLCKKVFCGCNEFNELNFGKIFKDNIGRFNGKGGGNKNSAHGSFTSEEDLLKFYGFLNDLL